MTVGTIGIIGCPILEDEIVYSLINDKDEKNVYVVNTDPADTLIGKLQLKGVPYTLIDEWDFDKGFYDIDRTKFNIVIIMDKLGLHSRPDTLRSTVEEQMRWYQERFDVIALFYGMCGNAGWDASVWASKNLRIPVFVFRDRDGEVCDDCIGVAVGGHQNYYRFVKKYTGMFFVTPAIAENWEDFSGELNFTKGFDALGIHTVKEVFALFGYKKMVKIDTGIGIQGDELEKGFANISEITGLEPVTVDPGTVDMYPTERLYRDAKNALKQ